MEVAGRGLAVAELSLMEPDPRTLPTYIAVWTRNYGRKGGWICAGVLVDEEVFGLEVWMMWSMAEWWGSWGVD